MRMTTRLRELLSAEGMLLAPFTYDGFTARIAQEAGFDAVYMSGFGTSMSKGLPDVGLLTPDGDGAERGVHRGCG